MILANVASQMFFPLLPLYLRELEASVSDIGLFFTLSMIVPLALQITGGWISDRIGRLKAIAIGSVGGALGWVGIVLAPSWQWLLASQAVGAVAFAFVAPSYDAFIAEQSDESNRAKVFGVTHAIYQVVAVAGPLLGGLAFRSLGWRGLIWIGAALYFGATFMRIVMARNAAQSTGSASGSDASAKNRPAGSQVSSPGFRASLKAIAGLALSGGVVTWLLLSDGVRDIAMGLSGNLLPLFLQEERGIDVASIATLNALLGGAGMLVMIPAGHLADRFGERFAIAGGYLVAFCAFALMLLVPSPLAAAASFVVFGAAMGMLQPAYQSLISKAVPPELRGIAFGFLSTSNGVVALPAPWLGAMLWRGVAPVAPFWVTAAAMLVIVPPVLAKFKLTKAAG
jgi:MFS family permease